METALPVFGTLAGLAGENSPGLCPACVRDLMYEELGCEQAQGAEPQPFPSSPSVFPGEKSNLYFCGYVFIQKIFLKPFFVFYLLSFVDDFQLFFL